MSARLSGIARDRGRTLTPSTVAAGSAGAGRSGRVRMLVGVEGRAVGLVLLWPLLLRLRVGRGLLVGLVVLHRIGFLHVRRLPPQTPAHSLRRRPPPSLIASTIGRSPWGSAAATRWSSSGFSAVSHASSPCTEKRRTQSSPSSAWSSCISASKSGGPPPPSGRSPSAPPWPSGGSGGSRRAISFAMERATRGIVLRLRPGLIFSCRYWASCVSYSASSRSYPFSSAIDSRYPARGPETAP